MTGDCITLGEAVKRTLLRGREKGRWVRTAPYLNQVIPKKSPRVSETLGLWCGNGTIASMPNGDGRVVLGKGGI
jgi:hypothetical protein